MVEGLELIGEQLREEHKLNLFFFFYLVKKMKFILISLSLSICNSLVINKDITGNRFNGNGNFINRNNFFWENPNNFHTISYEECKMIEYNWNIIQKRGNVNNQIKIVDFNSDYSFDLFNKIYLKWIPLSGSNYPLALLEGDINPKTKTLFINNIIKNPSFKGFNYNLIKNDLNYINSIDYKFKNYKIILDYN